MAGGVGGNSNLLEVLSEFEYLIQDKDEKFLRKAFASAHLNVLLGSGFSSEIVPTLGNRESWFQGVDEWSRDSPQDSVRSIARGLLRAEYFHSIMFPLRDVRPKSAQKDFISAVVRLIENRGATTLPQRVNIFTTNYDPMVELSLEEIGIPFNDGFTGRVASQFEPSSFSRLMYEQSLFMEYVSQVTTANVLKPHGSLTWRRDTGGRIVYSRLEDTLDACLGDGEDVLGLSAIGEIADLIKKPFEEADITKLKRIVESLSEDDKELVHTFTECYDSVLCIVNPAKRKFEETVLEQSYYDLLRIYANELDRNNALLLVFGFSFADEHILELTKRAARSNPKLMIVVSCHSRKGIKSFKELFPNADNIYFLVPKGDEKLNLENLTKVLRCVAK